jgi:hypothetical protein
MKRGVAEARTFVAHQAELNAFLLTHLDWGPSCARCPLSALRRAQSFPEEAGPPGRIRTSDPENRSLRGA